MESELLDIFTYQVNGLAVNVHKRNMNSPIADRFNADGSGAATDIDEAGSFQYGSKHVHERLPGFVGCRPQPRLVAQGFQQATLEYP
jgi:hypothetical protein